MGYIQSLYNFYQFKLKKKKKKKKKKINLTINYHIG